MNRPFRLGLPLLALPLLTGCPSPKPNPSTSESPRPALSGTLFHETAAAAGLKFVWQLPGKKPLNILQTIGNGCAFLDYDNDGNLDILLVGPRPALYRGDGTGKFTDARSLLKGLHGYFLGCATGDWDNDGFVDLYLSGYREGRLLHNDAGKGFTDVTAASGLKPQPWGTSCAFGDVDGDGKLDLFVGNYAVFGPNVSPQLCLAHGVQTSCGPREYKPELGKLLRGDGKGRFVDITAAWGADKISGKTLGAGFADFDGSGRQSLYLANDEMAGDLLQNHGGGMKNVASVSGTAYDSQGVLHGGMGMHWGDVDNDGRLDLFVATYQNEVKNLYHNDDGQLFTDHASDMNLADASPSVAFGCRLLDFDNDGWLDLAIANGHVQDNIEKVDASTTFRQKTLLFHSNGGRRFENVSAQMDEGASKPIVGRGMASGDYDNDGRVDLLVVDSDGAPLLLHNETIGTGHWVGFTLSQRSGGNRDAYGALVTVETGGQKRVRHCHTDGSYMSASDRRVHIGLGAASKIDRLTVRWPDGKEESYTDVSVDRYLTLERGGAPK